MISTAYSPGRLKACRREKLRATSMSLQTRYLPIWEFYRAPTLFPRAVRENR